MQAPSTPRLVVTKRADGPFYILSPRAGFEMIEKWTTGITKWCGSNTAILLAFTIIVGWLVSGPVFQFSDTWQLVINTGTTIITFVMVFVIQKSQNKENRALHVKIDELIRAIKEADNSFIALEEKTEKEIEEKREI